MALKVKSNTNYGFGDDLSNFFSLPVDLPGDNISVSDNLKERVYSLDIDAEEKSNILTKINKYNTTSNIKEKNKLKKEIDSLIEEYE